MTSIITSNTYHQTLRFLKQRIYQAQYQAFQAVNKELVKLYWDIGKQIVERQEKESWGKSVVEQLAKDLRVEFPGVKGFSPLNLWRMRQFFETYRDNKKLSQLVTEIGWGHNVLIMHKVKDYLRREFYIKATIRGRWSRHTLSNAIKNKDYEKWLSNQSNYEKTLDSSLQTRANFIVKDDYNLSFLSIKEEHAERELEEGLTQNIIKFLSEMGGDFCFIGRQYRVEINDNEFFIDLLFFHRGLKSLVAVELKAEKFRFEHMGQIGGYLSALDHQVRKPDENPSIGIIICKTKDRTMVEYALNNIKSPVGVATYSFKELPAKIAKYLPSESEISRRLSGF